MTRYEGSVRILCALLVTDKLQLTNPALKIDIDTGLTLLVQAAVKTAKALELEAVRQDEEESQKKRAEYEKELKNKDPKDMSAADLVAALAAEERKR